MAREDVRRLHCLARIYCGWDVSSSSDRYFDRFSRGLCCWMDLPHSAPEKALAGIMIATTLTDDPNKLGTIAAGNLEDLLRGSEPMLADRITAEARMTPRIRWMLAQVNPHAIDNLDVRQRVLHIVNGWTGHEPVPPKPWV